MCILVPACSVSCRLVYLLLPGVSVSLPILVLPCLVSTLKTVNLSLRPRLRVLVPPCCVHHDRIPDLTVSGAPSPRFVFPFFFKIFCFVPVCLSRGMEVATRPSALARVKSAWEFGRDRRKSFFCGRWRRRPRLTEPAADSSPVDPVHMSWSGVPCLSCRAHRNILNLSCLVLSTETHRGQAAPLVMAEEAIPSRLPPVSRMWKR